MSKSSHASEPAFTILELLVSMAVLSMLMLVLVSLTEQTRKTWKQTSQRIDAFGGARVAFESMTRNLSQATLNTYWDYDSATAPQRYVRRSELRFISGNIPDVATALNPSACPTHAVFFQAPLGYVADGTYHGMENLLNTCGYYLQLADDSKTRPAFLTSPSRERLRLMQLLEPSESLTLYTGSSGKPAYNATDWFTTPLGATSYSHVLAENVIALVIIPEEIVPDPVDSSKTVKQVIGSSYSYSTAPAVPLVSPQPKTENQLPPLLQVTMVAIDEASAQRLQSMGDPVATLGLGSLFSFPGDLSNPSQPGYAQDLKTLESKLQSLKLTYRIFTSVVSIRGAKWSREQ